MLRPKVCFNKDMHRLPVESSDIVSIGYDPAAKILEVEFQGGRVYQYRGVEPDIHAQFMRADSYGTFFFAHVNGQYRYDKISATPEAEQARSGLAFASGSETELHDLQMACEPYNIEVEPIELPVDEIQSDDPEDIAVKKAKQAYKLAAQPVIVSVSSWNILSLHGFPGAYLRAIGSWLSAADLLKLLEDKSDRSVCLTHVVAFYDGKRHKVFTQDYWGTIAAAPRGEGTAVEQIVVMTGQDKTLAELHVGRLKTWAPPEDSAWHDFAKWFRLQQRLQR
jgi:XTP/dITP diphosphohydrolase